MPDLSELLAAEVVRQQPTHQPAFADLVRVRRGRDRRNRIVTSAALVFVVGLGIGGVALLGNDEPAGPDELGGVTSPSASGSGDGGVTVTGILLMTGGPRGAQPTGVSGTVSFQAATGAKASTTATADGTFSTTLPPGQYVVTGTSPAFGDGQYLCRAEAPITVSGSGLSDVQVICGRR